MTSVINLKDGTMISANTGKQMLEVFKSHPNKPSIFDYFDYMDRREDYIRAQRDNNTEFERYFTECCEAYQENPDSVFPQRRPYYGRRGYRKPQHSGNYNGNKRYNNSNRDGNNHSNGASHNNGYQKNHHKAESSNKVSLAEQFLIRTENDKLNKKNKSAKKGKKNGQNGDKVSNEFFEQGKEFIPKSNNYQEEETEDQADGNKSE